MIGPVTTKRGDYISNGRAEARRAVLHAPATEAAGALLITATRMPTKILIAGATGKVGASITVTVHLIIRCCASRRSASVVTDECSRATKSQYDNPGLNRGAGHQMLASAARTAPRSIRVPFPCRGIPRKRSGRAR